MLHPRLHTAPEPGPPSREGAGLSVAQTGPLAVPESQRKREGMGLRGRGHPPAGTAHKTPDTEGEGASQVFVEGGAHPAARAGHGAAVVRVSSLGFLSPARLSRAGGPQRAGDGAGLAKVRQEGPGRPGQGVRQWRTAAFPARSAEKAGGPGWPRPRDTGVLGRPARSLELRKHQPSQRGGRKSKITGQLRWFRPGAQRDDLSLGAVLGSGAGSPRPGDLLCLTSRGGPCVQTPLLKGHHLLDWDLPASRKTC